MFKPKWLLYTLIILISLVVTFELLGIQINDLGEELLEFNITIILIFFAHIFLMPPLLDMALGRFWKNQDDEDNNN
ncbi:MAG: hypothetical protein ACO3MW_11200 [Rhodospirillales bacterium]